MPDSNEYYRKKKEDLEALRILELEEEAQAKKKAREDLAWQEKQISSVQEQGSKYGLFARLYKILGESLRIAHQTVGFLGQVFPPLNAVVSGVFTVIDLVEAAFISKETRNRRAVRIANSIVGTGLSTAAIVLTLNPATTPLGLLLSTGSIAVSAAKEGFFWYKASKHLKRAKKELRDAKLQESQAIHSFLHEKHDEDIKHLQSLDGEINELEKILKKNPDAGEPRDKLIGLQEQRNSLRTKIDFSVNNQKEFLESRKQINFLKKQESDLRVERNEARRSFVKSALSFVGAALLTGAALMVAAAVVVNPIAAVGIALIGVTVVLGIKEIRERKKSEAKKVEEVEKTPLIEPEQMPVDDNDIHVSLEATERIVHQLSAASSKERAKQLAPASVEPYRNSEKFCQCKAPRFLSKPLINSHESKEITKELKAPTNAPKSPRTSN